MPQRRSPEVRSPQRTQQQGSNRRGERRERKRERRRGREKFPREREKGLFEERRKRRYYSRRGAEGRKTGERCFEMNRILYVDVSLQHEIRKWSGRKPVVSISPYTHHRGRPTASAVAMHCSSPRPAHGANGANGQCPRPPPSGTRSCRARSRGRDEPTGGACTRGASRRPGCSRCRPH